MAAEIIDRIIEEHSAVLILSQHLEPGQLIDLYREQYQRIESAAVDRLIDVLDKDADGILSLAKDVDPVLQMKLQRFAWRFYPKVPELLN
jgi:hypothetical protein